MKILNHINLHITVFSKHLEELAVLLQKIRGNF